MVSRNERKQGIRENGSHRQDRGSGIPARGGPGGNGASRHAAGPAARDAVGQRPEYSVGTLDVLVGMGGTPLEGRSNYSANPPALGNRLMKNLFIAGTQGVGKTMLLREVTLAKREHIGGFYTEHIMAGRIRKGFMIRTFDGQERMLASKNLKSSHKLGKYGVDV